MTCRQASGNLRRYLSSGDTATAKSRHCAMKIVVSDNQVDKALRVLKKKLIKEGLLKEMKKREYYEKPSVKRKRKQKESRKRLRKLQAKKTP